MDNPRKSARLRRGLGFRQATRQLNTSLDRLWRYENKRLKRPDGTFLAQMAREYGCTMEDLLDPNGLGDAHAS